MAELLISFILAVTAATVPQNLKLAPIGEITVTGKKPTTYNYREDITRKQIITNNINSVAGLSKISPMLNTAESSRGDTFLFLSGYNYHQLQLFIDGVPVYVPFSGDIGAGMIKMINIDTVVVESVLPSLMYGPNAMGGIVNIETKTTDKPIKIKYNGEGGTDDNYNVRLSVDSSNSNFYAGSSIYWWLSKGFPLSKNFTPGLNEDGGIRNNSGNKGSSFYTYAGVKKEDNYLTLRYYYINENKDVPPEVNNPRPRYWRFTTWQKNVLNLHGRYFINNNINIKLNSAYIKYYNILDAYDNNTYSTQTRRYAFHSTYDDYSLFNSLFLSYSSGILGTDFFGFYKKDQHKEQSDYNKPWDKYLENTYSLGTNANLSFTKYRYFAEVRYDILSTVGYGNDDSFNYRTGLEYFINNYRFSLIAGSTSRFPSMKERYSYHQGRSLPNPKLKPEYQRAVEINYKIPLLENIKFSGKFFYSKLYDLIQEVYVQPNISQNQNIGKATAEGFNSSLSISDISHFNFLTSIEGYWGKTAQGTVLPYRPRWKITGEAGYNFPWNINFTVNVESNLLTYYQDSYSLKMYRLNNWVNTSLNISKKWSKHLETYINVNNIFDTNYETEHDFPAAGRMVYAGIRGTF